MNKELKMLSGFTFDYSNMIGDGLISEVEIEKLSERISSAALAVATMRESGIVRGHLSKDGEPEKVYFSQLPYVKEGNINSPNVISKLKEFGESLRYNCDAVVSLGIGGSYLGNKVLFDVQCGEFWNAKTIEQRNGFPKLYFSGNNIDPKRTTDIISTIVNDAGNKKSKYRVTLVCISKSGGTLDTMSNFMVAYGALKQNVNIDVDVVAVTDPAEGSKETLLHRLAKEKGWPMFSVPDGIGGRFSVFSEVGLITGACIGFDIEAFLEGARHMDEACQGDDAWQNPALLNATLKYLAAENHGRDIEVFMPYADYLKSVAEWYIQLLAESLGKKYNRSGDTVYYGRTPIVAVGTTDMHAQTQQHQEGKQDKVVQFVQIAEWDVDPIIPNVFPEEANLSATSGIYMSQALEVAREANAAALIGEKRMNANFILPKMNAYHLGELLYLLALSVAYEGELADVDAFDQPGVEAYKRIMGPKLKQLKK